jgi:hypothetical protein
MCGVRRRALTPLIAGVVSGGFVAIAWIVGFIIFYVKRRQHEAEARALGYKSYKDFIVSKPALNSIRYYIPPDPAVVYTNRVSGHAFIPSEILVEEAEELEEGGAEKEVTTLRSDRPEPGSPSSQQLEMTPSSTTLLTSSNWLPTQYSPDDSTTSILSNRDSDSQYNITTQFRL